MSLNNLLNEEKAKNLKLNTKINQLEDLLNNENNVNKNLNIKLNNLEISLKEEKDKNRNLNNKINELERNINDKIKIINEIKTELKNNSEQKELYEIIRKNNIQIEELKNKLSRYPFELLPEEKIISVIFTTNDQKFQYSIICKNTDIFINIELKLYNEYPQYKEVTNYFLCNGKNINKYKSLKENEIKNSDVIILNTI